jgi:hypothetical protein
MTRHFKAKYRVEWNSEAGRVTGAIIRPHTSDFIFKGYTHHASPRAVQRCVGLGW